MTASAIYHIATVEDWSEAGRTGAYRGGPAARADGFLHCSTAEQIKESAKRHWAGRAGVLLALDPARLGRSLKWETSRGGKLFPHVYGDIPLGAVLSARALPLGSDGAHVFPDLP